MERDRKFTARHDGHLLESLMEMCEGESRTKVKSYLTHGQIMVNDRNITAFDHQLKKGDSIVILARGTRLKRHSGETDTRVRIVYEDDWLIVAEKKSGLLTISTGSAGETTAYSILTEHVRRQAARKAGSRAAAKKTGVYIVHRIDRDTSGLIIFAKDLQTRERLQENWNRSVISRKYVAVLEGSLPQEEGTWTSWLKENSKSLKVSSSPTDNGGKMAVTHYHELLRAPKYSLAEFELETGRKNQIRVHSADMGCPIAGDKKYGARSNPLGRLALHARSIAFIHPVTGRTVSFDTGIPRMFRRMFSDSEVLPKESGAGH